MKEAGMMSLSLSLSWAPSSSSAALPLSLSLFRFILFVSFEMEHLIIFQVLGQQGGGPIEATLLFVSLLFKVSGGRRCWNFLMSLLN